ncbi:50S ribosomal protein L22 [bacterium]|nr:50S ribosomal protein L22 [bacterium]
MKIKAVLSKYRMSPKKIRPILSNLRGMKASEAISVLNFLNKKAADPIKNLVISAVSNAKNNNNLEEKDLYISEVFADEGKKLKRYRPRARGSAFMVRKRSSRITVVLENKTNDTVSKVEKNVKVEEVKKSSDESKNIKQDNKS